MKIKTLPAGAVAALMMLASSAALGAQTRTDAAAALGAHTRTDASAAFDAVISAERAFARATLQQSAQSAFLQYLSSDALLYRPRVVKAAAYLRARPMVDHLAITWEPVFGDISAAGDLAWTTGPWISSDRRQPQVDPTFGQYVHIWRKQADGSWKTEVEAGIAHEADSVGPGKLVRARAAAVRRTSAASARTQLLSTDSALAHEAERTGAAPAFARIADPQLRLLRRGRFPLERADARAYLRAASGYTWRPVAASVSSSGDVGYTYGVYAVTTGTGSSRRATETGDYLRIWRRDAQGEWRVILDLASAAQ